VTGLRNAGVALASAKPPAQPGSSPQAGVASGEDLVSGKDIALTIQTVPRRFNGK